MTSGPCEIGSVALPNSSWLFTAVTEFHDAYGLAHPYMAFVLCVTGTVLNLMTIVVLTRPSMISPVNVLLSAVAVCDMFVMTSYLIFVGHFLILAAGRCSPADYNHFWAIFTILHAHLSVILHSTSIWLTVSLAQIRVLTISRATSQASSRVTIRFTIVLSCVTIIIMCCFNLPNFLTFEIVKTSASVFLPCLLKENISALIGSLTSESSIGSTPIERFMIADTAVYMVSASSNDCIKLKLAFWTNGILFKVLPCLLLTIFIAILLRLITHLSHRRRKLAESMKRKLSKDRTTPMLVAVLSIFLIAELPQGVMLVLTGIFTSNTFHQTIYLPMGDFMDLLSLINSAVNFLIYCIMNKKFRITFLELFCRCTGLRKIARFTEDYVTVDNGYKCNRRRSATIDYTRNEELMLPPRPSTTSLHLSLMSGREQSSRTQRFVSNTLDVRH